MPRCGTSTGHRECGKCWIARLLSRRSRDSNGGHWLELRNTAPRPSARPMHRFEQHIFVKSLQCSRCGRIVSFHVRFVAKQQVAGVKVVTIPIMQYAVLAKEMENIVMTAATRGHLSNPVKMLSMPTSPKDMCRNGHQPEMSMMQPIPSQSTSGKGEMSSTRKSLRSSSPCELHMFLARRQAILMFRHIAFCLYCCSLNTWCGAAPSDK